MIGLPSLSQLDTAAGVRVWLCVVPADMRCGFDRLAELAASVTGRWKSPRLTALSGSGSASMWNMGTITRQV